LNLADLMIVCPHRKGGTLPPERRYPTKRSFFMGLLTI
jgi:hypothetical protein